MGIRALGDSAWLFELGGDGFQVQLATQPPQIQVIQGTKDEVSLSHAVVETEAKPIPSPEKTASKTAEPAKTRLGVILKVHELLQRERIPEVRDIVSSFDSIAVHFDPLDGERVLTWLTSLPTPKKLGKEWRATRTIEIPVLYGKDLEKTAEKLGKTPSEVITLHSQAKYTVATIGFSPGFPYLTGLPTELQLPRHDTPRPVEPGTVAIAGNQAGIYPDASQAGWHTIGHTDLQLFNPERENPSLLQPGDQVKFTPISSLPPPTPTTKPSIHRTQITSDQSRITGIEVIEPGAFTTVQDSGRPGYQHLGVSPGGSADPVTARVANYLLGNPSNFAVLECCLSGPVLKFHKNTRVSFLGWNHPLAGRPIIMEKGSILDLRGKMPSVRGYIAVAGGITVPKIMGSRATDVRSGFGGHLGRALQAGDLLPTGPSLDGPSPGDWSANWPHVKISGKILEIRFLSGMQASWFSVETSRKFRQSFYQVSPVSDRMGIRLDGAPLPLEKPREMISQPVIAGSIQVPPNGRPIILTAERQTIGGYPQIGHVISADLPKLARAWPGSRLHFLEVSLQQARNAWKQQESDFQLLKTGLLFR